MKLQDHIESIAKVAEVAGKEYSIEQVCIFQLFWYLGLYGTEKLAMPRQAVPLMFVLHCGIKTGV
jgi:hypothetical protein